MQIRIEKPVEQVVVIHVDGRVDGSNFKELIASAEQLLTAEMPNLILNLAGCDFLSSAGLMALHSIAKIASGEEVSDPEKGWSAFHAMSSYTSDYKMHFKLVGLQPAVSKTLDKTGMLDLFEVYDTLEAALAAF